MSRATMTRRAIQQDHLEIVGGSGTPCHMIVDGLLRGTLMSGAGLVSVAVSGVRRRLSGLRVLGTAVGLIVAVAAGSR
jgi:hypothetical protein